MECGWEEMRHRSQIIIRIGKQKAKLFGLPYPSCVLESLGWLLHTVNMTAVLHFERKVTLLSFCSYLSCVKLSSMYRGSLAQGVFTVWSEWMHEPNKGTVTTEMAGWVEVQCPAQAQIQSKWSLKSQLYHFISYDTWSILNNLFFPSS